MYKNQNFGPSLLKGKAEEDEGTLSLHEAVHKGHEDRVMEVQM